MGSRRKPGLWLPPTRVEVEAVTARHKKPCSECKCEVEERRLKIVRGTGRHAVTLILCMGCGIDHLRKMGEESRRAIEYLACGDVGPQTDKLVIDLKREYKKRGWDQGEKGIRL